MATQSTKIIDVTRSFVPVAPDAFPETMHIASKEDGQEKAKEVVVFEGYNFMPTSYGYKSYFGTTSKLDIDAISSRVDYLLILQSSSFVNIAVALCEDGIWTKRADSTGAWEQEVTLAIPDEGIHYDWSYCFLDNDFFAYRASSPSYYRFSNIARVVTEGEIASALPTILEPNTSHPANAFYSVTPTFLNMAGQIGIFKAGSRLGFWDSANSIAWSSIDDYAEFTPAVLTMAGSSVFSEVQGRITVILDMADGFVVYSTKSITMIARDDSGTMQWDPLVLLKEAGVAFKREACKGDTPLTQYAYTSKGLIKVEGNKASTIVEELSDFLKESKQPVFLTLLENRYLFLEILDGEYVDGLVSFTTKTIPTSALNFPPDLPVYDPNAAATVDSIFNGEDASVLAQIDAYIIDNGLPSRALVSAYSVHGTGTIVKERMLRKVDEAVTLDLDATVNPIKANGVIVAGSGNKKLGVDNPTYTTVRYYNSGAIYSLAPPYDAVACAYDNEGIVGYSGLSAMAGDFNILPGYSSSYTSLLNGFPAFYVEQLNAFTLVDTDLAVSIQSIFSLPKAVGKIGMRLISEDADEVVLGVASIPESRWALAVKGNAELTMQARNLAVIASDWSPPTVTIATNGVATIKRHRTHVLGINSTYRFDDIDTLVGYSKGHPLCGAHYSHTYSAIQLTRTLSGAKFYTPYEAGVTPVQYTEFTIDNYGYSDTIGNINYVPSTAVVLPAIPAFYYSDPGSITYPPISFLLQDGSIGPVYPTIPGALVYDLQLKKWGKMKMDYKVLVDWQPLNNLSGSTIPYETFGMQGGVLKADGTISLFDKYPVDSYIKYGKIGYFRQGFTSAEEIRASMRDLSTCTVRTEASLDGTTVELGLTKVESFTNVRNIVMHPSTSARWHTVSFIGIYDIKHLEFRGTIVGNR